MLAFLSICIIFNTFLAKRLPMVEGLLVLVHILGVLIFVPVWALTPRMEGPSPLIEFYNPGGWSSYGIATLVGSVAPVTALIGFDCSVHMGLYILQFFAYPTFTYLFAPQPRRLITPLALYHSLYLLGILPMLSLICLSP
jgi:hypothetical protein